VAALPGALAHMESALTVPSTSGCLFPACPCASPRAPSGFRHFPANEPPFDRWPATCSQLATAWSNVADGQQQQLYLLRPTSRSSSLNCADVTRETFCLAKWFCRILARLDYSCSIDDALPSTADVQDVGNPPSIC
jgi:hypothetical protein